MPAIQSAETPEQTAAMGHSYRLCGMFPDGGVHREHIRSNDSMFGTADGEE